MNIKDLDPDDLIGAIRLGSKWRIFAGTVAEWVLDYATYDPDFDPSKSPIVFRNNILRVEDSNAKDYLLAMEPYELSSIDLHTLIDRDGAKNWPLYVIVNFDERLYVNGYPEIPLQRYIPENWLGAEDSPLKYVPKELANIWG